MVSSVNSHKHATPKRWHLWEIELNFVLNSTRGWQLQSWGTNWGAASHRAVSQTYTLVPLTRKPSILTLVPLTRKASIRTNSQFSKFQCSGKHGEPNGVLRVVEPPQSRLRVY